MQIGEKVIIKHNDNVLECKVLRLGNLDFNNNSSDDLVLIDEQGNEYTRKYWEVNKKESSYLKPLDIDKIPFAELPIEQIIKEDD